jgi:hypothetical protein
MSRNDDWRAPAYAISKIADKRDNDDGKNVSYDWDPQVDVSVEIDAVCRLHSVSRTEHRSLQEE